MTTTKNNGPEHEENFVNQWVIINRNLKLYKILLFVFAGVLAILSGLAIMLVRQDPVVVVIKGGEKFFSAGVHQPVTIDENDVKGFIREFIELRYAWKEFNPKAISEAIRPISTEGFRTKSEELLEKEKEKSIKDKKVEQVAANIDVQIQDKKVIATFDRIIRIDGIPLIAPAEVQFNIVRDTPTRFNPIGLYVNGIIEDDAR